MEVSSFTKAVEIIKIILLVLIVLKLYFGDTRLLP